MNRILILLLALATLVAVGCRTLRSGDFAPDTTWTYKRASGANLKLHVFRPDAGPSAPPRPAIVFFFGGGWRKGSPRQFYPHCAYLASRGMVAISAEYRVEETHGTTPRECVEDGKSAVRWIRMHAGRLGVDPARVAAGGGSAGGHVAAIAGMTDGMNAPDEDVSVSSRPDALVLFNPVIYTGPGASNHVRVRGYWRDVSPWHNVDQSTPPMMIFLGTEDRVVSVERAREFESMIEAQGGRCDLYLYEGQYHGFFNFHRGRKYFAATLAETDRFLQSLGYLSKDAEVDVAGWLDGGE